MYQIRNCKKRNTQDIKYPTMSIRNEPSNKSRIFSKVFIKVNRQLLRGIWENAGSDSLASIDTDSCLSFNQQHCPLHMDTKKAFKPSIHYEEEADLRTYGIRLEIGLSSFLNRLSLRRNVLQSCTWTLEALVSMHTPTQCCLSMLHRKYILFGTFSLSFSTRTSENLNMTRSFTDVLTDLE